MAALPEFHFPRASTPITPAHSPQHSFHSVQPHNPLHSLSLHEYRKQQASSSTPIPTSGKRIKRKAAASGLNAIERLSPVNGAPPHNESASSLPLHQLPLSEELSSVSEPSSALPLPSFRSLPSLSQQYRAHPLLPPFSSSPSHNAPPNFNPPQFPQDSQGIYSSTPSSHSSKRSFKSRKRLPRPKNVEIRAPLPSEPSSLDLLSDAGLRSTSTFTLSKYPFPSPPDNQQPQTPPATPAVLHYRGTSFDVVNPHQSLYLCTLETPADQDLGHDDYFYRKSSLEPLLPDEMDREGSSDGATPPTPDRHTRPLYNDLSSAYSSITKNQSHSLRPSRQPSSDSQFLSTPKSTSENIPSNWAQSAIPQQPTPAKLSPKRGYAPLPDTLDPESLTPAPLNVKKTTSPSFLQRVFSRRGRPLASPKESVPEESTELQSMGNKRASHALRSVFGGGTTYSTPAVVQDEERDIADPRISVSDGEIAKRNYKDYYDAASLYRTESHDEVTRSLYFDSTDNRRSIPFGVRERVTDYSSEADITSFSYEFGTSPRANEFYNRSSQPLLGVQAGSMNPATVSDYKDSQTDSTTVGSIINNYNYSHSGDVTEASLDDFINRDEDTITLPGLPSASQTHSQEALCQSTSGLSQFDFGLDHVSKHSESVVSSPATPGPRTPEDGTFPRAPGIVRASAGAPPSLPLPELLSPAELHPHQTPFARGASGVSTNVSHAGSYGDTRKLLGLSGNLESESLGKITIPDDAASLRDQYKPSARDVQEIEVSDKTEADKDSSQNGPLSPRSTSIHTKRLSQISYQSHDSNLSGSVLVVAEDKDSPGSTFQGRSQKSLQVSFQEPCGSPLGTPVATPLRKRAIVANAGRLQASPSGSVSGIPMMWRKASPIPQNKFRKVASNLTAENEAEDTDGDWETIGPSRAELHQEGASFVTASSASSVSSAPEGEPPIDDDHRTNFQYSRTGEHVLRHKPSFSNVERFSPEEPSIQRSNTNPWRNPRLPQEHNINSIDPSSSTMSPEVPRFPNDSQLTFINPNKRTSAPYTAGDFSPSQINAMVEFGPNSSILAESATVSVSPGADLYGPANIGTPSTFAGLPDGGLSSLRSFGAPDRENSFEKLTVLGPKGNITGTPMGTGMREVGSSLAPSSTPMVPSSTSRQAWTSTHEKPTTPASAHFSTESSPFQDSQSPLQRYSTRLSENLELDPQVGIGGRRSSYGEKLKKLRDEARSRTRGGSVSVHSTSSPVSYGKQRTSSVSRPSVSGQNRLRDLRIQPPDTSSLRSEHTRLSHFVPVNYGYLESRPTSSNTATPLRPQYVRFDREPGLVRLQRTDSSVLSEKTKRRCYMSMALFAVCVVLLPPVGLLYGKCSSNTLVQTTTDSDIQRCSRRVKRFTYVYGITMTVSIIIAGMAILALYLAGIIEQ